MFGVSEESKAYKLYDRISMEIVISRDVIFEEERKWDWNKSYEEHLLAELEWGDEEGSTTIDEIEELASEEGDTVEGDENGSRNEIASSNSADEENIYDAGERRGETTPSMDEELC